MNCDTCTKESGTTKNPERLRRGAKRYGGKVFCPDCWRSNFVLRAVVLPVAAPLSGTWAELNTALHEAWASTTGLSNWMMTELYARDVRRNGQTKMPPMTHVYLYPDARRRFPSLTPQSVVALEQAVTAKYRAKRYEIIWTAASSLPTFRYPTPFPVHNQSWSVSLNDGKPVVSTRIGEGRWELRLKAGRQAFGRQLAVVGQMVSEVAIRGELALYRHHDGTVLCKMVAWLPRPSYKALEGLMLVRTGTDHFITAQYSKDAADEAWYLNADHIRRWIHEYERKLQRLREDRKAEQRPIPAFHGRQQIIVEKQRRRMDSAVKEIAAQVAAYANRRHAQRLDYNDSVKIDEAFPWFLLKERLKTKCDEYGIQFNPSVPVSMKEPEPLAIKESQ